MSMNMALDVGPSNTLTNEDPWLDGLDRVPGYLTAYRKSIDLDISKELRDLITEVDRGHDQITAQQFYENLQFVIDTYTEEKGKRKGVDGESPPDKLAILAVLFWEVTRRTKIGKSSKAWGKRIPYWGEDIFNYLFILGSAPPEVAAISWRLTSGEGLPLKDGKPMQSVPSTVVELYKLVKLVCKNLNITEVTEQVRVYEEALVVCKENDTTGETGLNCVWSAVVQNAIVSHFGCAPQSPKGSRRKTPSIPPPENLQDTREATPSEPLNDKRRVVRIPEHEAQVQKAQAKKDKAQAKEAAKKAENAAKEAAKANPSAKSPMETLSVEAPAESPGMAPVKPKAVRKVFEEQVPTRATYPEEKRITQEIGVLIKQLAELRAQEIPQGQRVEVQEMTILQVDSAIAYLNARCSRILRDQREQEGMSKKAKALEERAAYERACRSDYFLGEGYEFAKPGQLVDYDREIKQIFRDHAKNFHPDRNGGDATEWLKIQKVHEIIWTYTETHQK